MGVRWGIPSALKARTAGTVALSAAMAMLMLLAVVLRHGRPLAEAKMPQSGGATSGLLQFAVTDGVRLP
jgi:hypothetical protein